MFDMIAIAVLLDMITNFYCWSTCRYTSIGSMENTHPNPDLKVTDDKGIVSYRPAYELTNYQQERAGRN